MRTLTEKPWRFVILHPSRVKIGNRALAILAVLLVAALVSLSSCAISDTTTNRETAVTAEIDQIFDDYITAFNNYDLEAVESVLADGYMLYQTSRDQEASVSTPINREYDRKETLENVDYGYPAMERQWERLGDTVMSGDSPWLVSQVIRATSNEPQYPNGIEGISILTIVDENGTLKVARDVFVAFEVK